MNNEQLQIVDELVDYFLITRRGNKKVGKIYSWSIPAVVSCTGATEYCIKRCYAIKTAHRYLHPRLRWARNFEIAQREDFAQLLSAALSQLGANLIRIHVSGDFFSAKYLLDWIEALTENPHIKPFAFTRGWRDKSILKAIRIANTPQWLFASTDPETGSDIPAGMHEAAMVTDWSIKSICPQQKAKDKVTGISTVTCKTCGRCPGFKVKGNKFQSVTIKKVSFIEH